MQTVSLDLQKRELTTKGQLKALRRNGIIPGVIYGKGKESLSVKLDKSLFYKSLREGMNEATIISINMEDVPKDSFMIIKQLQRHPVTEEIIHADFQFISMDEVISTTVHIELAGSAKGVKQGGIVEHILRELEIEALPRHIPSVIKVDISPLELGKSIHVSDLNFKDFKILTDPHSLIVKVELPKTEEEVSEEDQMSEPEVIEKGKKDSAE